MNYQLVSVPNYRKSIRFEHKYTVILTDEQKEPFTHAQMLNFSNGGLYFKSDVALNPGTKIKIRFGHSSCKSEPKALSSVVRWCRKLTGYDSDYNYGVGVEFI